MNVIVLPSQHYIQETSVRGGVIYFSIDAINAADGNEMKTFIFHDFCFALTHHCCIIFAFTKF